MCQTCAHPHSDSPFRTWISSYPAPDFESSSPMSGSTAAGVGLGQGQFSYDAVAKWAQTPPHISWPEVAGVAVDSRDHVYVFNRGEHPVVVFDRHGTLLRT